MYCLVTTVEKDDEIQNFKKKSCAVCSAWHLCYMVDERFVLLSQSSLDLLMKSVYNAFSHHGFSFIYLYSTLYPIWGEYQIQSAFPVIPVG